eukprot:364182-Chlamydomonas_euryale.AAC.6
MPHTGCRTLTPAAREERRVGRQQFEKVAALDAVAHEKVHPPFIIGQEQSIAQGKARTRLSNTTAHMWHTAARKTSRTCRVGVQHVVHCRGGNGRDGTAVSALQAFTLVWTPCRAKHAPRPYAAASFGGPAGRHAFVKDHRAAGSTHPSSSRQTCGHVRMHASHGEGLKIG